MWENLPILIIDDDPDLLRISAEILKAFAPIQTAQSWHAARHLIGKTRYRLILLDLLLPDAEPLEALRQIHEIDMDYPVVVMSGQPDLAYELMDRIMASGIQNVLKKPFSATELLHAAQERCPNF